MFQLQSDRIKLLALNEEQLTLLSQNRNKLEKSLGLTLSKFELNTDSGFLQEFSDAILNYVIPLVREHPQQYEWFTHWLIVDKAKKITVGGIGGTGLPNENGEVMIGYFIDKKFEKKGYATEAVQVFTNWLSKHEDLKTIIADTPLKHISSQRVLQKAGFELEGEVEEGIRWQLNSKLILK